MNTRQYHEKYQQALYNHSRHLNPSQIGAFGIKTEVLFHIFSFWRCIYDLLMRKRVIAQNPRSVVARDDTRGCFDLQNKTKPDKKPSRYYENSNRF